MSLALVRSRALVGLDAPEVTVEELVAHTDMTLKIADTVLPMEGCK